MRNKLKKLIVVFCLFIVLGTFYGCDFSCLLKDADMEGAPENYEYSTIIDLKNEFSLTDEEKMLSITDYGEDDVFNVYKRAFHNFLEEENYFVVTKGYSYVDTFGGIKVNVHNEKKFNGTDYFMHMSSLADKETAISSMSNTNAMHYLHVDKSPLNNTAIIKKLGPKDDSKVIKEEVCTEKDYVFNYGQVPYSVCDYVINQESVKNGTFAFDEESGLYEIDLVLYPAPATKNLIKKMHMISGTDANYGEGSVRYQVFINADFKIIKTISTETYKVNAPIVGTVNADAQTSDAYYYVGDEGYEPLENSERYDLSKVPDIGGDTKLNLESMAASTNAFSTLANDGINANFTISIGDFSLNGRLQLAFTDKTEIQIDIFGEKQITLFLALSDSMACSANFCYGDLKVHFEVADLSSVLSKINSVVDLGLDESGIKQLLSSIDIQKLISSFENINGERTIEGFTYSTNLSQIGLPIELPLSVKIVNDRVSYFGANDVEMNGKTLSFSLVPSENEKDLSLKEITVDMLNVSPIVSYAIDENFDLPFIKSVIENKKLGFNLNGLIKNVAVETNIKIDFSESDNVKALVHANVDGGLLTAYYEAGIIYLSFGEVNISIGTDTIMEYANVFGEVTLPTIDTETVEGTLFKIISSCSYLAQQLLIPCGEDIALTLKHDSYVVTYKDVIGITLTSFESDIEVEKPNAQYRPLEGLTELLTLSYGQLFNEYFTINGNLSFNGFGLKIENLKIHNSGSVENPIEAFNNGLISIEGTILLTLGENQHKLEIKFVNNVLCLTYNEGIKLKLTKPSLDYILTLITEGDILSGISDNKNENIYNENEENFNLTVGTLLYLFKNIEVDGGLVLKLNGLVLGFDGDIEINLKLNEENELSLELVEGENFLNLSVSNSEFSDTVSPSNEELEEYFDVETLTSVLISKKVSFDVNGNLERFTIQANVDVDFTDSDNVKVLLNADIDGAEITAYYEAGIIYLSFGDVCIFVSVDTLIEYANVFKEISLPEINLDGVKEELIKVIAGYTYSLGQITLGYNDDLTLFLKHGVYSLSYNDVIDLTVTSLSSDCNAEKPDKDYNSCEGLAEVLKGINEQLSNRYFIANGNIMLNGLGLEFKDIKIHNFGNVENPTEAFDNGELTIEGTLIITSGEKQHKLDVQYVDNVLFVTYNEVMKVKFSRESLDYILDLGVNEYRDILDRLNYSDALKLDVEKLLNFKLTLKMIPSLLREIKVNDGALSLKIDGSSYGFESAIQMIAKLDEENRLSLTVIEGNDSGSITLENYIFDDTVAPTGEYFDLSNLTYLVEGLVNTVLKEGGAYYLSGTIDVDLGVINAISMDVTASIRLIDDENGGKKVEAIATVSTPTSAIVKTASALGYINAGEGTLVYKDGQFFIKRVSKTASSIFSSWKTSTSMRKMSGEYFGANLLQEFSSFLGFGNTMLKEFEKAKDHEIKPETLLKGYSGNEELQIIEIYGKDLSPSETATLGDITARVSIADGQLTKLYATLPIKVSILTLNATADLAHNPYKEDIDFSAVDNLDKNAYTEVIAG